MAADTAALVVALSAQLTKFEKDMQQGVQIAQRRTGEISRHFDTMNSGIVAKMSIMATRVDQSLGGIGTRFLGAAGVTGLGIAALADSAIRLGHELAKIPGLAREAGISTDKLQEIKFAANIKGLGDEDFIAGMRTSLSLLDDAQRNVNTLQRLFNANGISIRNANGQLRTFDDLLEIAARLMVNTRDEQSKIRIAEMLGLSRDWVRVLRDGPEAFRQSQAAARGAGAVIQRELLDKAKEFDELWTRSVVRFKAGIVSAITDVSDRLKAFLALFTAPFTIAARIGAGDLSGAKQEIDRLINRAPVQLTVTPNAMGKTGTENTVIPQDRQKNAFERALYDANKRIATLDAETASIGQNSEARERAKLVAELQEAAIKANTDAGFQNATVTDAQREKIEKLADAMFNVARRSRESHEALARFAVEGRDFAKQFDQFAISSFGNLENALTGIITGAKTAKDAFHDMATAILADLAKMIIRMQVTAPLAQALGGFFSPSVGPGVAGKIGIPGNAGGTDNWGGGLSWVGERGPELLNLPRGAQVIPNDLIRRGGGGNVNVVINDMSGHAKVNQQNSGDGITIEMFVPAVTDMMANQVSRGRGSLAKVVQGKGTLRG